MDEENILTEKRSNKVHKDKGHEIGLTNPPKWLGSVPALLSHTWGDQSVNLCKIGRSVIILNHVDELLAFGSFSERLRTHMHLQNECIAIMAIGICN